VRLVARSTVPRRGPRHGDLAGRRSLERAVVLANVFLLKDSGILVTTEAIKARDLEAVGHKPGSDNFPNKGVVVGRRNEKNEIVPHHYRGAIEAGALDGQKLEICWLRDSFEPLSIQFQGSALGVLADGTPPRPNYDAHKA